MPELYVPCCPESSLVFTNASVAPGFSSGTNGPWWESCQTAKSNSTRSSHSEPWSCCHRRQDTLLIPEFTFPVRNSRSIYFLSGRSSSDFIDGVRINCFQGFIFSSGGQENSFIQSVAASRTTSGLSRQNPGYAWNISCSQPKAPQTNNPAIPGEVTVLTSMRSKA